MEQTKRYYWIKLKTDFFNLVEIDFLLSQKDGCQYIVLYQMLCLQTANNNGELASRVVEMIIPYDPDKIARDTKYFSKDTELRRIANNINQLTRLANEKIITVINLQELQI